METPQFQHDCSHCIFLGRYVAPERFGGKCDLYFCPRYDEGSVLARFSDEGCDYSSGPIACYPPDRRTAVYMDGTPADMTGYPLHVAYDLVVAKGLWKPA